MRKYFYDLTSDLASLVGREEVFTAYFSGESSDFCRFNNNQVRQAGHVMQRSLSVNLIHGLRNARAGIMLTGDVKGDHEKLALLVKNLRARLPDLPDDPHLLYATTVRSGETAKSTKLRNPREAVAHVIQCGKGLDLVGLYSSGGIFRGFANSFGQRNWFESHSFGLDWSFYHHADKAVKTQYAGFEWKEDEFQRIWHDGTEALKVLEKPAKTVTPGKYRVYLTPSALGEFLGTVCWGGFGLKAHKTKQTPLIKMVEEGRKLHAEVTLTENTAGGVAPNFDSSGFVKPDKVVMIEKGAYKDCLVSARSAKEYGVAPQGATREESPESLDMAAGTIPMKDVLSQLEDGLYINNLHYTNYSDHAACRITGLTRFATFWVQNGQIAAPVNVMRFDETVYNVLGDKLVGLTKERELSLDSHTYEERSTGSVNMPGALVSEFTLTL